MLFPGWLPHAGQQKFLETSAPVKVLACGRRWGKSEVAAVEIARCLLESSPRQVLLVAPSQEQGLPIFERVGFFLDQAGQKPRVWQSPHRRLQIGKSRLWMRSVARGGVYLRGRKVHLVVVDEAAYVPEKVVKEVLMPMLADTGGRLVLVSTPRGKNYFYRLFLEGQWGGQKVWSFHSPSWNNPALSRPFALMQQEWMTRRQFQIEYGAAFLDESGQVFRTEWVDQAVLLNHQPEGMCVAGVDWARYRDYTAVVVLKGSRQEAQTLALRRWQGIPWAEQVAQVAEYLKAWQVERVICDQTGVGDPLLEMLMEAAPMAVEGVVFNAAVKRRLTEQLALMLEKERLSLLSDRNLLQELYHFEAVRTGTGVRVEAAPGYADDLVIATALAVQGLPDVEYGRIWTGGRRSF